MSTGENIRLIARTPSTVSAYRCRTVNKVRYGAPGVSRIWGEWLFILRELGAQVITSGDLGSKLIFFGDLGSPAKKQKKIKEKPPFCLIFF